jgi:hypothetical protein
MGVGYHCEGEHRVNPVLIADGGDEISFTTIILESASDKGQSRDENDERGNLQPTL